MESETIQAAHCITEWMSAEGLQVGLLPHERVLALSIGIDRRVIRAALTNLAAEKVLKRTADGRYSVALESLDGWWTTSDIAKHFGMPRITVSSYRRRKHLPPEDKTIGRKPVWCPERIKAWQPPIGTTDPAVR